MLHLLYDTIDNLALYIKKNKLRIVVYGAGMIGSIVLPDWINRYQLLDSLDFYVDADTRKQGTFILINDMKIKICSPEKLNTLTEKNVLVITNSNYNAVLSLLDQNKQLDGKNTIIFPIEQELQIRTRKNIPQMIIQNVSEEKIPKVIHYCWFSGNELPDYLKRCMESWEEKCPDYEIRRWDESNYDIHKNPYMEQAYQAKKWGFVPDYARLDILYNHGGFYLDTDVELLKSLDTLRGQGAFCGVEKWGNVNMGGCSGAVKHHPMIRELLLHRGNIPFIYEDGSMNLETCGVYETKPFIAHGMKVNNTTQRINNVTVFASDFFHPYDYMSGKTVLTQNTFSIHHFNGGWLNAQARQDRLETMERYNKIVDRMCTVDGKDKGTIGV